MQILLKLADLVLRWLVLRWVQSIASDEYYEVLQEATTVEDILDEL